MTTPPAKAAATMVVPCGANAGTAPLPGSRLGAAALRNSVNEDEPGEVA